MLPKSTRKALNAAIVKSTRNSIKPPKEKHVKNIAGASLTKDTAVIEEIIQGLCKRLDKNNWVVVLKTLMVFHRCFRDGDVAFIEALRTRSAAVFGLKRFSVSAPTGNIYTLFVQKYAKYLEENVSVLRLIGFQFERNRDCCKDLTPKEAFKRVPKLQSQLNALLNCKMRPNYIGKNPLIVSTYILLLKDSLVLYPMLNVGVIGLIDQCFKMKKKDAQRVLEIYSLFVKETEALINLYENSRTFTSRLPPIHPAKPTLAYALSAHISKLEDGDEGDYSEEGEMAHMEPEPDFSVYSNHQQQPEHFDDDSDTSSDSSDDDEPANFGGAFSAVPAHMQQPEMNSRASVGPNSWGYLTAQQQQAGTTSQGWNIFDSPGPSVGGGQAPPTSPGFNGFDANDPFAAFSAGTASPVDTLTYQERASNVKAAMNQHYSVQQQPQPRAADNPFGAPAPAAATASNPFANPSAAADNPFGTASPKPSSPSPNLASNTGYNPFL